MSTSDNRTEVVAYDPAIDRIVGFGNIAKITDTSVPTVRRRAAEGWYGPLVDVSLRRKGAKLRNVLTRHGLIPAA